MVGKGCAIWDLMHGHVINCHRSEGQRIEYVCKLGNNMLTSQIGDVYFCFDHGIYMETTQECMCPDYTST